MQKQSAASCFSGNSCTPRMDTVKVFQDKIVQLPLWMFFFQTPGDPRSSYRTCWASKNLIMVLNCALSVHCSAEDNRAVNDFLVRNDWKWVIQCMRDNPVSRLHERSAVGCVFVSPSSFQFFDFDVAVSLRTHTDSWLSFHVKTQRSFCVRRLHFYQ